jgi:hypothetical protein
MPFDPDELVAHTLLWAPKQPGPTATVQTLYCYWALGPGPFYPIAQLYEDQEPWPGWCRITDQEAKEYQRQLARGLPIPVALTNANLPPDRPGCPEPPSRELIELASPAAVTTPPPPPPSQRGVVGVAREAERPPGRPPRRPRPPRLPRAPRSARRPRASRPPRTRRATRAARPPRRPRTPRPPREPRKKAKRTSTWCKYEITSDGRVYAAPTIILPAGADIKADDLPEAVVNAFKLAGGQPVGTRWSNQYGLVAPVNSAGRCVIAVCSGPLNDMLKKLTAYLPQRWRITDEQVKRAADEQAMARFQRRRYAAQPPLPEIPRPTATPTSTTPPTSSPTGLTLAELVPWNCAGQGCLFRGMILSYCLNFPPGIHPNDVGGTGTWQQLPMSMNRYCLAAVW